mmetsp:Transcript_41049/g.113045  ORF Transcript_41049/g.113045 Transcript_41049/m.113045 type:complete len:436 (-) Transcript_41049:123-1430(-)
MPKVKSDKASKPLRHNPLAEEIIEDREKAGIRRVPRTKQRASRDDGEEETALPAKMTQKVLQVAQAQKASEEAEFGLDLTDDVASVGQGTEGGGEDDDEVISDVEVDADGFVLGLGTNATEEEERALAMFLPGAGKQAPGPNLADIILQKIQEHEGRGAGAAAPPAAGAPGAEESLSPKVIQVYSEIGKWLKHYKAGKLPKAFKVVPSLTNWEEVLSLTNPLGWSPAAMYEAVAIFASNLNPKMAQRFYNLVLLPAVRQNIAEYKKLNFHYYRSLRKALFKPAAFFKGILLPLAMESCTLREAVIMSSVLGKASIPPMHVAATVMRLAEMTPWYGTTSILLGTLVNKKYAFPVRVIEALVSHFCAFARDGSTLPLVWHRSLLLFVQRYKFEFNEDQKRRLRDLLKVHFHEAVGVETKRELMAPKPGEAPTAMDMS